MNVRVSLALEQLARRLLPLAVIGAALVALAAPTVARAQTVVVTAQKNGSGTVDHLGGGPINCGSTCSGLYALYSSPTFRATPATGWVFLGWSGACSGSTCRPYLTAPITVIANFARAPAPIPYLGAHLSSVVLGSDEGNAVDGNLTTFARSLSERRPYLEIDLGGSFTLDRIEVFNRQTCCWSELDTFDVELSSDAGAHWWWYKRYSGQAGLPSTIDLLGLVGNKLRIRLVDKGYVRTLSVAEVNVYGNALTNLARYKPASQSSIWERLWADYATDDDLGTMSHTDYEVGPTWEVDLGAEYPIHFIDVFNRTDCCVERLSDFYIEVSRDGQSWNPKPFFAGQAGVPTQWKLPAGTFGRYVRIRLFSDPIYPRYEYLNIPEVRVWRR